MGADGISVLKNKGFDKSKWMQFPRDVVIGHRVLDSITEICQDLDLGRSALIVTGSSTYGIAGRKVEELIGRSCDTRVVHTEEISMEVIRDLERAGEGFDFFIGVGGGRVIDTAKIVSYNLDRQFISIPTAASHDGIASARASVPSPQGSASIQAHPPIAIVADTEIIAAAPHRLLASGCADIISNYTAILDWELSHRITSEPISEYAIALSRMTAEMLMKNADIIKPNQEASAWLVTKALVASGVAMSIAGSSRPASGGEHKFSLALERLAPGKGLHGERCGIGTIMAMFLHGGDWRGIRGALAKIGAPTTPTEIGVQDEIAVEALLRAREVRPERFTILDTGLTRESAEALVKMLYRE
ncbi:MAG: NAD(P)-dependent glycerol-1-phosphate dehydrogenase [Methanomicrobiales archaeon]|nr:NAD(P)-dependent glycerol-1-phosphate dehydrogenase [Methanomicrobiales archaeon]